MKANDRDLSRRRVLREREHVVEDRRMQQEHGAMDLELRVMGLKNDIAVLEPQVRAVVFFVL